MPGKKYVCPPELDPDRDREVLNLTTGPWPFPWRAEQSLDGLTESTGQKLLSRLDAIDRRLDYIFGDGFMLGGRLLTQGNLNEATARESKLEFDRLINGR